MQYQVDVELTGRPLTETEAEHALDELPGLSAVVSHDHGHPDVLLTVPADTVVQATTLGIAAVERATGRTVTAAQVVPTEAWDARQGFVPLPELIGATEAAALLGVSRQRVAQLVEEGKLPGRRAGNALVFARGTVEAYQQSKGKEPASWLTAGAAISQMPDEPPSWSAAGAAIPE